MAQVKIWHGSEEYVLYGYYDMENDFYFVENAMQATGDAPTQAGADTCHNIEMFRQRDLINEYKRIRDEEWADSKLP